MEIQEGGACKQLAQLVSVGAENPAWLVESFPSILEDLSLIHVKWAWLACTCDPSILKVEAGESRVEKYLQLLSESEASLGYMRP